MIGVIAGTGSLPTYACNVLSKENKKFFVICLFPEDNLNEIKKSLPESTNIITEQFYKVGKILNILKQNNTKNVLFIGKIDKQNLLKKFKLDWLAIKLLSSLGTKSDMAIMEKANQTLEKNNISVIKQSEILKKLFVKPGILTGKLDNRVLGTRVLDTKTKESIDFGIKTAKKLSQLDIGQTVIVKEKMILAVEAIEGTNKCIKRGITLGKNNIIVCKAACETQSKKFDLPTIGPDTIKDIKPGEIKAIAWDSSKTFIAEKEKLIKKAQELSITLVSV